MMRLLSGDDDDQIAIDSFEIPASVQLGSRDPSNAQVSQDKLFVNSCLRIVDMDDSWCSFTPPNLGTVSIDAIYPKWKAQQKALKRY